MANHNRTDDTHGKYGRRNVPWTLVWSEAHPTYAAAVARERQTQSMKLARWIRETDRGRGILLAELQWVRPKPGSGSDQRDVGKVSPHPLGIACRERKTGRFGVGAYEEIRERKACAGLSFGLEPLPIGCKGSGGRQSGGFWQVYDFQAPSFEFGQYGRLVGGADRGFRQHDRIDQRSFTRDSFGNLIDGPCMPRRFGITGIKDHRRIEERLQSRVSLRRSS